MILWWGCSQILEHYKIKKAMKKSKLLPVGTPVFDVRYGWGEVEESTQVSYPLYCRFKGEGVMSYTKEGHSVEGHKSPILSLTEYNLTEGGFTSVTEFDFDAPKAGDFGYFWDDERVCCVYGKLVSFSKTRDYPFESMNTALFKNFSKEIPEHIKKLQV